MSDSTLHLSLLFSSIIVHNFAYSSHVTLGVYNDIGTGDVMRIVHIDNRHIGSIVTRHIQTGH